MSGTEALKEPSLDVVTFRNMVLVHYIMCVLLVKLGLTVYQSINNFLFIVAKLEVGIKDLKTRLTKLTFLCGII